jgi:D-3-phosphoglycerate dehydrogenase
MLDALRAFATVHHAPEAWRRRDELVKAAAGARVLLTRNRTCVDAELLERLPGLGCVAVYGAGREHLDLGGLECRGIAVVRCSEPVAGTIAEFTLGLALALLRRLPAAQRAAADEWRIAPLVGQDLAGLRVLVVGCGPIGERTARSFALLGAEVTVVRRSERPLPASLLSLDCQQGILLDALAQTQLVSLHLPGGKGTSGLLGRRELTLIPPGGYVINTSRGSVLDLEALLDLLRVGHLAGAALDVLPEEPPSRPLPDLPGLLVTPHIALYSQQAIERRIASVADQVRDWLESPASVQ